jgi:hypothetical protein
MLKIILCFLLIGNPYLLSQNFFPLKVGNKYQIKDDWYGTSHGGGSGSGTSYFSFIVSKDTLINGLPYYSLIHPHSYNPFPSICLYHYDSLVQKLFVKVQGNDTIRLAVDFTKPVNSQYFTYMRGSPRLCTSLGVTSEIVMGDTLPVYSMRFNDDISWVLSEFTYYFANSIGLSKLKIGRNDWPTSTYRTDQYPVSAIIDSIIFNPIVLKIDSIYPLKDRPINTFPFVMTVKFTSTYAALIDSFSIFADHVRVDSIINSKKFNVSVTSPSINLFFNGLNVGDKIRLKAFIRDRSIFSNIDYYPDSGWVTMTVLSPFSGIGNEYMNSEYKIEQNYPNPFNSSTVISWHSPINSWQTLKVYDVLGNEVATLVDEYKPAGSYEVEFSAGGGHESGITNLVSGIYFYQLKTGDFIQTRKMLYLK